MSTNPHDIMRARALRVADHYAAAVSNEPVRNVRERREAFCKMLNMLEHVRDYAHAHPGKPNCIIGDGYYVAHDGESFIVKIGSSKVFQKSIALVASMFDPLKFVSGHL